MTKEREALKLALEALEEAKLHIWLGDEKGVSANIKCHQTITAIKEALAQPEQEPVAKVVRTAPERIWLDLGFDPSDEDEISFGDLVDATWSNDNATGYGIEYVRADTTPPQRTWVGLTDEEIQTMWQNTSPYYDHQDFALAIEAKLKEKNT